VIHEKKMKSLSLEMRVVRDLERHKERIMKKNIQGTPINMKKVVNV
jgi:hypothetical protein